MTPEMFQYDLGHRHQYHGAQSVLSTADVAEAVRFYRDRLDFDVDFVEGDPAVYARVRKGDRSYGDPVFIHLRRAEGGRFGASRLRIHVGSDVDDLFCAVRARGVSVVEEPESKPWGLREFTIHDFDRNELCFCGYLPDVSSA